MHMSFTDTPRSSVRALSDGEIVDQTIDTIGGTLEWAQTWATAALVQGLTVQWFEVSTGDMLAERNELGDWTVYPAAETYRDDVLRFNRGMNAWRD
jgi:hypothetical protein